MKQDRTARPVRPYRAPVADSIAADAVQLDEFRRRATTRPAQPATAEAPAGQIPGELTTAFLNFVTLLNERTDGASDLEAVVRQRSNPAEVAGIVPLTEDTAVAILAALTSAVNVRPTQPTATGSAPAGAEPTPEHTRPAWVPQPADVECATRRLRDVLAPARPLRLVPGDGTR